ncbi:MAG: Trm112 family protein [Acidobacteriota bacterium]|nr:Trm112 family protein [Acidobacteriota bacterium]
MPLDDFLLGILEDPVDHGELLYVPSREVLYNPRRRGAYEVRDSIPVMLPDEARAVDDEEHRTLSEDPAARATGSGPR